MGCNKSKPQPDPLPPSPPPAPPAETIGYYSWNWSTGSYGPSAANVGVAFTGYVDVAKAVSMYVLGAGCVCPNLVNSYKGKPYITIGGGNEHGNFTVEALSDITNNLDLITPSYSGIIFDIEIANGDASELVEAFQDTFKAAKAKDLEVGLTIPHSAPFETDTPQVAIDLVTSWAQEENIDFISPQLYSAGNETSPDFEQTGKCVEEGCTLDLFKGLTPKFVPSIVDASQYDAVHDFFWTNYGINCTGYFQWAQVGTAPSQESSADALSFLY
mgnify:CR=1 FL=1